MERVNLSLLPKISHGHAWFMLDATVGAQIRPLRRTSERLENSIKFMWFSDSNEKILGCAIHETERLREGFLRAALAELVSIEEILHLDLAELGRSDSILKMNDTELPHVHLVRELRNHELHLHHSRLSGFRRDRLWGNIAKPEDATPLTLSLWLLDGVTPDSFSQLRNAKNYSNDEIRVMLEWFNDAQAQWGVHEILLRAAHAYGKALGARYFP